MKINKQNQNSKFRVGEPVMIKSKDDITKSLHPNVRARDGCLFTEQMWGYCGSEQNVLKVVNTIFNEHRQRTFKIKSPLYILENLVCDGKMDDFPHKCDHSCFLLWHEEWLEKTK